MLYLSYSGFKKYDQCPYAYWHSYIGKTPPARPDDRLGSIFGSAIGVLFEEFYTQRWWKKRSNCQPFMLGQVERVVDDLLKKETSPGKWGSPGGVLLWKGYGDGRNPKALYSNRDELVTDVKEAVVRGLRIVKHYRLLGPRTEAEKILDLEVEGNKIGGRADFIIRRTAPHGDLLLLDGKGSRHRGRYVDPKQLHWYAMLYRRHFNEIPDKLAFLYWKFDPPDSIDWVEFSEADLDMLLDEVLTAFKHIGQARSQLPKADPLTVQGVARGLFRPKPNPDNCRFCAYASKMTCPNGAGLAKT
jgi:hypothetical protein